MVGDLVLKWDAQREVKGRHGKFGNLLLGPFQVVAGKREGPDKVPISPRKVEISFEKRTKERNSMVGDLVLKWDARREVKGRHGKFGNLLLGPFQVVAARENNTYELTQLDGELFGALINGRFLKNDLQY
jgi:hypothetical protein